MKPRRVPIASIEMPSERNMRKDKARYRVELRHHKYGSQTSEGTSHLSAFFGISSVLCLQLFLATTVGLQAGWTEGLLAWIILIPMALFYSAFFAITGQSGPNPRY